MTDKKTDDDKLGIELIQKEDNNLLVDYEAREARLRLEENLKRSQSGWQLSPKATEALHAVKAMNATKHGLYASVPIICKADACPYAEQCPVLPYGLAPEGELCIREIDEIDKRQYGYAEDIGIEESSFVDKVLLQELVTLDVILERCKFLMAKDGSPVIQMSIGVDQEGNEIVQPAVSKAWEAYEKVSKRREQVFSQLMLTRKDNKNNEAGSDTQSAMQILQSMIDAPIDVGGADIEDASEE